MAKKLYTEEQVREKFKGQAISLNPVYDEKKKKTLYEVRRASKIIRGNSNVPKDETTNI